MRSLSVALTKDNSSRYIFYFALCIWSHIWCYGVKTQTDVKPWHFRNPNVLLQLNIPYTITTWHNTLITQILSCAGQ